MKSKFFVFLQMWINKYFFIETYTAKYIFIKKYIFSKLYKNSQKYI